MPGQFFISLQHQTQEVEFKFSSVQDQTNVQFSAAPDA
jgi:hypothetical protein